jgi:hypothetical protein
MKTKNLILFMMSLMVFAFTACNKDDDNSEAQKGLLRIEVTDAPVDDAKVEAVFVTIADVKIDGQSVEGFNKTTVDLLAYQNGSTFTLVQTEMEARSYNSITFELDFETDAQGNSPACYVRDENGTKHPLASGSVSITKNMDINIESGRNTEIVADFDLRKAIKRGQGASSEYEFVSQARLNGAVRAVNKQSAGKIAGACNYQGTNSDMVVVYAYHKGSFNRNTEVQGSSETNLKFHNAVSSAKVQANGNYELHFLEEGEYELHFASYERNAATGRLELKGSLVLDVLGSINLESVSVNAASTTTVNVQAISVLPI